MHSLDDTIAAIASPPGGAARAIVRLSGPDLRRALEGCFRPTPYVALASIARPTSAPGLFWLRGIAAPLPGELYLWPGTRSYTGQPVAEAHVLGSPPLVEALLRTVCAAGARPAEPGEFTLRAFLAGRIDMTQAEAVLGVIDAADSRQLHAALAQLAGGLAAPLHRLRDSLVDLLAQLEAGLDFAEEDLPAFAPDELIERLDEAAAAVAGLAPANGLAAGSRSVWSARCWSGDPTAARAASSMRWHMGPGPWFPISREPPAITSRPTLTWTASAVCWSIPAASRRSPKANWTVRRRPFPAQHRSADLRIFCVDASANDADIQFGQMGLVPSLDLPAETILVLTKTDLPRQAASSTAWAGLCSTYAPLETSSRSGAGLDALRCGCGRLC